MGSCRTRVIKKTRRGYSEPRESRDKEGDVTSKGVLAH